MAEPALESTYAPSVLQPHEDSARSAGRGGLAVAAAKVYFILLGFLQKTALARVLGAEGYGAFSSVLALANVANNVVITSSIQSASRVVAQTTGQEQSAAQRGALRIQSMLSVPVAVLFALIAPEIALRVGAPHVVIPVRVVSLVLFAYGLYAPLVGILNGKRRFVAQASLDATYATLRTVGMLVGGWLLAKKGMGPLGSTWGFVAAALVIVPIAAWVAGVGEKARGKTVVKASDYLLFWGPIALGQLFLNALMQSDSVLLRLFASNTAKATGLVGKAALDAADRSVAIYSACQTFSFLPYQLLLSIAFVLFPLLAKAYSDNNKAAVALYVRTGMRLSWLFAGGMVAIVCGLANQLLHFAFKPEIADYGASTLRVLAIGQGAFALFGIQTTVLASLRRERTAMVLNGFATALVWGFAFLVVPGTGLGAAIAQRQALATSLALAIAFGLSAWAVVRVAGALVPVRSVMRVVLALGLAAALGAQLPLSGRLVTPLFAIFIGIVYLAVLLLTREFTKADWALVRNVLGRVQR